MAYPFSSRSSQTRNWTEVFCIACGFFTNWVMREAQYLASVSASLVAQLIKKFTCNEGDPSSILGLGRSCEGIGYPFQYSWASLVVQMVKNPPAMWETWVQSLAWKDPLEEGIATYSSILAWGIPMDRGAQWATANWSQRVGHDWATITEQLQFMVNYYINLFLNSVHLLDQKKKKKIQLSTIYIPGTVKLTWLEKNAL